MSRVNVYLVEDDASARYRLKWPAEALIASGFDVKLCRTGRETRDADVCVFNRPIREAQADAVEQLQDMGKKVVVDIDDNFDALRPEHAMYGIDTQHLHRACKAADTVTVSTPALVDVYGYGHGKVVPNCVPGWMLEVSHFSPRKALWVGWSGTISSHPNDLQSTCGEVAKAMSEVDSEFVYIGPKEQSVAVRRALQWSGPSWVSGWFADHRLYCEAMSAFDVGIVPLETCEFNDGKSWLKGLELAALGVPFVAADSPEYRKLGAGLVARTPSDWKRLVRRLLDAPHDRADVARQGRAVASGLTIEKNLGTWSSAWWSPAR